ncbi:MAG TPA: hypothetical protein VH186_19080 [Chloroflexia bacterium]|nr:hypothetical protein [Chloroflexia bacterium]
MSNQSNNPQVVSQAGYGLREQTSPGRVPPPSEVFAGSDVGALNLHEAVQNGPRKMQRGTKIFIGVVVLLAVAVIAGGILVVINSINSASNLGDMPAYPGAGAVSAPGDLNQRLNAQLKQAKFKAETELGLAHDSLDKVQNYYVTTMKGKDYTLMNTYPAPPSQFYNSLRSLKEGFRFSFFSNTKEQGTFYMFLGVPVTDRNLTIVNSEFNGLQARNGDTLYLLAKIQVTK